MEKSATLVSLERLLGKVDTEINENRERLTKASITIEALQAVKFELRNIIDRERTQPEQGDEAK